MLTRKESNCYYAVDMAAPDGTDILDVTGHWSLNRTLSDSLEETFALVSMEIFNFEFWLTV